MDGKLEVHRGSDIAEVLDRIENGDSFGLTVNGKVVAQILPTPSFDRAKAQTAAHRILELSKGVTLGPDLDLVDMIRQSRKA